MLKCRDSAEALAGLLPGSQTLEPGSLFISVAHVKHKCCSSDSCWVCLNIREPVLSWHVIRVANWSVWDLRVRVSEGKIRVRSGKTSCAIESCANIVRALGLLTRGVIGSCCDQ